MPTFVTGTRIEWTRWWLPRDCEAPLEHGMLQDPGGQYGQWLNPDAARLADYASLRCLTLLGDAGSGKSDELDIEVARLEAGVVVIALDLGGFGDWPSLRTSL